VTVPRSSQLRCYRLADLQRTASAYERMVLDQADGRVQIVGLDQRVPADVPSGRGVTYALGGYGFRCSERSARVDHVVAHAREPRLNREGKGSIVVSSSAPTDREIAS
jgi:hypothetical protein